MFYQTACRPPKGRKNAVFLSMATLTFDHDIQTRLSKGPNTSSCEFGSGDISHTNKKVTDSAKNRTLRSSLHAVNT